MSHCYGIHVLIRLLQFTIHCPLSIEYKPQDKLILKQFGTEVHTYILPQDRSFRGTLYFFGHIDSVPWGLAVQCLM